MKPILFDENATTFTTNGLGRLDCISCKVTEERNGMYELEAVVPESAKHFSDLAMSRIIVARPSDGGSLQPFRIYKITKPINGKSTVYAQHISYQLSYIPTMPFSVAASSSACATTLSSLKSNAVQPCPFTFWTDVTTVASYNQEVPSSIRQRLGGIEGSVLDQFGGEYEWDNYAVKLHKFRGVQNPTVTLRYGKNITDIEQEEYISNTITGVCPFWRASDGSKVVTLSEKVVESQYASQYPFKRTVPLDLSTSFEEEPTQSQLRVTAQVAVNKEGVGIPTVSIKVSFVALWQTEEYKDIAPLQRVNLCDKVNVQFEKLGINTTAKVVKTVYDVLAERYESVEIGSLKTSLAQAISDTNSAITTALETTSFEVRNATAWLTGSNGYVVANRNADGSWKELLFMDTPDTATAHNVLRINENGLGFSRNGVNGPYTQAWTLDGKLVIGGTNVPSLTVYDASGNVLFQVSRSGTVWNSPKSSMTANGVLTAEDVNIRGTLAAYSSSGSLLFRANSSGVVWNSPKSSMTANGVLTAEDVNIKGTLAAYDANENLLFRANSSGVVWNATNSSMTANGTLTANNAVLKGTFTSEGGNYKIDISNGVLNAYRGSTLIGRLYLASGSSSGMEIATYSGNPLVLDADGTAYISGDNITLDSGGNLQLNFDSVSVGHNGVQYFAHDGNVVTEIWDDTVYNVATDLEIDLDAGSYSFNSVTITYLQGYDTEQVIGGIVV